MMYFYNALHLKFYKGITQRRFNMQAALNVCYVVLKSKTGSVDVHNQIKESFTITVGSQIFLSHLRGSNGKVMIRVAIDG